MLQNNFLQLEENVSSARDSGASKRSFAATAASLDGHAS
jgi:hypothetical protein